jgi:hypothetical protein
MLPNQIFNYIDRMGRVIEGMSLLDRFFRRNKPELTKEELPEYLKNPNLAQFRKLFQNPEDEQNQDHIE